MRSTKKVFHTEHREHNFDFFNTSAVNTRINKKPLLFFVGAIIVILGLPAAELLKKVFLHDVVVIDKINNLSKTVSGSLIFAKYKFVGSTQTHTATIVSSENYDFAKSIAGAAAGMPARTLAEQQQYT